MEKKRLNESAKQISSVRRGLATIIPLKILSLFTWEQIEEKACGKPDVNVLQLQECTKVNLGNSEEDEKLRKDFWECLSEFTNKERCLFVRFACGLSRLPVGYQPSKNLKIVFEFNEDDALPRASTCFWSLYLPRYSSKEIMKKRILTAIVHCTDIDADYTID